ncbi:HlyD family type I secretion periplasmic adaptor subunit [Pseudooceanicola sp. MF1-13]|uniref:HlyD family type I secretion periplasmic adaptor subunit n=1 Tax=Pseudooceanicola sp. MF1-13 TaxID=3379095 RepID=UPI003892C85B
MTLAIDTGPKLRTGLRAASWLGLVAAVALFSAFVYWAQSTNIAGAVIATGTVEVVGKPKSVQHLDGGVVEEILVEDGQSVTQGDVLVRLDATLLSANLDIYRTRLSEAIALRERLLAEQVGADQITLSADDPLTAGVDIASHRDGQAAIFEARRIFEAGRREQLTEKIAQFRNQTTGVEGLIASKEEQLKLLEDELASVQSLADKGLARANAVLALRRNQADLLGQIAEPRSELARIQNSIRDTELEILQGERQMREQVATELRQVTNNIHELRQQILSTEKQLSRIDIRAPVTGRIHEMQITTLGGVVPPGATILQIVPVDEALSFSVRVDPASIDQVYVGQDATLRFPAFNQRTTPELYGAVIDVSPTSVVDEATGMAFYRVRVSADDEELARLGDNRLVPGMPVETYLQTGDRSVLSYLMKPLSEQLNQAFREE